MRYQKKRVSVIAAGAVLALGGLAWILASSGRAESTPKIPAVVYKNITCGCCANYVSYLRKKGFAVEVKEEDDAGMAAVRSEQGVPDSVGSCHTMLVGGYVVEGHVPVEAVNELLTEKPEIKGIALPGMPQGSPGMPGRKNLPFDIYSIKADGSTGDYLSL